MPRLPVFVQAQPGKHPVQDLPEPDCERGDPKPHRVSQDESRIALFVPDLLCRALRSLPPQRLHSKQFRQNRISPWKRDSLVATVYFHSPTTILSFNYTAPT